MLQLLSGAARAALHSSRFALKSSYWDIQTPHSCTSTLSVATRLGSGLELLDGNVFHSALALPLKLSPATAASGSWSPFLIFLFSFF